MSGYFTVDTSFWTDADVLDNYTPEDKYFYLYLLTSPYENISGCYEISLKQIAYDTGYSKETVERLIERFVCVHKVIDYNSENKEILVCNWGKYHWIKSPKYLPALKRKISEVKTEKFRNYLTCSYQNFEASDKKDMVWIPYQYGMDTSFTYTYPFTSTDNTESNRGMGEEREDEENKTRKKRTAKEFVPPTLEEVAAYARTKGYSIDCEYFWEYYNAGNWIDGQGKPVKNWKQKLITWVKSKEGKEYGTGSNRSGRYGNVDGKDQDYGRKYADLQYIRPDDESTWGA